MLGWLAALASAVAAAAVVAHWYRRRLDALGRRRAFPLVSVLLLAALAIGAAAPGVLRLREERRLAPSRRTGSSPASWAGSGCLGGVRRSSACARERPAVIEPR